MKKYILLSVLLLAVITIKASNYLGAPLTFDSLKLDFSSNSIGISPLSKSTFSFNKTPSNLNKTTEDDDLPNAGRLMIPLKNYSFSSGAADLGSNDISRLSFMYVSGNPSRESIDGSLELLVSFSSFSMNESGVYMHYEDAVYGIAYGAMVGFGSASRFYLRIVGGGMYVKGEIDTKITILGQTTSDKQEFSDFGFYYNAALGFDLRFSSTSAVGLTCEVGISKIPFFSVGLVFN